MSNMPDYINNAVSRMNEFLPEVATANLLQKDIKDKIPFGLAGAYDFYETEIFGERFLLVGIGENEDDLPPTVIAKQRDVLQRMTQLTPIFIFNNLAAYIFPRYAKKNLNIIAANRQLFLPSIFLIAGKEKIESTKTDSKIPNLFQPFVLYHLERERLDGMTTRDIAQKLSVSYATVNRCVRWMKERGFIQLNGGKEKFISFLYEGKKLWEKALPFLASPIDFIVYTPEFGITDKALLSEQNALAEYTMLNGGPHRIAISKEVYDEILKDGNVHWDQFGESGVEVWKYNPRLLTETGTVDRLSLYLLLKDYDDERVQIELENMMNEILW